MIIFSKESKGILKAAGRLMLFGGLSFLGIFTSLLSLQAWFDSAYKLPETTALLEDRYGNFLGEDGESKENLGYWPADDKNEDLIRSFIALEDQRFYQHWGVDPSAILRALINNLLGHPRQGASTLAMQVSRLQHPKERSFLNKLKEALSAVFSTLRYGREGVLRQYLSLVPQGNRIQGCAYAARRYFKKPLADISLAESALLTSLARFPGRNNIFSPAGFLSAKTRARKVLEILKEQKAVSESDYNSALRQLETLDRPQKELRSADQTHFILRALEEEKKLPANQRGKALRSSLDPDIQRLCQEIAQRALKDQGIQGAENLALMVVKAKTGEVLGYIGSADYFDATHSGSINYARTPRSSGSTLKPFLYALGLDSKKFTAASILADLPFSVLGLKGEYRVGNFDQSFLGPLIYRKALSNSRNIPALRVLEAVGIDVFYNLLQDLDLPSEDKGADYYGYGMTLGGIYVSLENLVRAYGVLQNDGLNYNLSWFAKSDLASEGRLAANEGGNSKADKTASASDNAPENQRYFTSFASRSILQFLSDNEARTPSFPRLNPLEYPFPVAVKTGTSQGFRDAWALALSSEYIVGLWMGSPDNQAMNHVAGMTSAAYVRDLFLELQPEQAQGINTVPFPLPEDSVACDICTLSGKLRGPYCNSWTKEYFPRGEEPRELCDVHQLRAFDVRSGQEADAQTPQESVRLQVRTLLGPEYGLWLSRQNLDASGIKKIQIPEGRTLKISYPHNGSRFFWDPDIPSKFQTLAFQLESSENSSNLVWWLNGEQVAALQYPYEYRWPLKPGHYTLQAGLADGSFMSQKIEFSVE